MAFACGLWPAAMGFTHLLRLKYTLRKDTCSNVCTTSRNGKMVTKTTRILVCSTYRMTILPFLEVVMTCLPFLEMVNESLPFLEVVNSCLPVLEMVNESVPHGTTQIVLPLLV